MRVFISGLVYTTRVDVSLHERTHVLIFYFCRQTAELFQMGAELYPLRKDRRQYLNNPLIGYVNITSVYNKVADLQIIIQNILLDDLVLSETKLDESFPNVPFNLDGYEIRARQGRDKKKDGPIVFVTTGIICVRINDFELSFSEFICSEFAISE